MKNVTLQVDGVETTFTEEELVAFKSEQQETPKHEATKTIPRPTEGVPFKVNPTMDRSSFQKVRKDPKQEEARQLILEAFDEVDANPEKYGKPFRTLIPKKNWDSRGVSKLIELAENLGDHIADWVEQALEWAQRITNGETWEEVCNNPDTANWYRLIKWKNYYRLVGGSHGDNDNSPASDLHYNFYYTALKIFNPVPLIVL